MPTKQTTTTEELDRLREALTALERRAATVGDEVEAERAEAVKALEAAEDRLRRLHASVAPDERADPARERVLREAAQEAEAAASLALYRARVDGARMAVLDARATLQAFIRERFLDLAAERMPQSIAAQSRLAAAFDETEEALDAYAHEGLWWASVMPAAGLARSELPAVDLGAIQRALPGEVPVPAPSSLTTTESE